MDLIHIKGLKAETLIGVHDWERKRPRSLLIDLALATDVQAAARSDRLEDALDYHAVSEAVIAFVGQGRVQLIETLAQQLAEKIQREFNVGWLSLTIHKPGAVPAAQDVSVTIERGKKP